MRTLADVALDAINELDRNTCRHETRHRGGFIWTICDDCGAEWADDRGGFRPSKIAEKVDALREELHALLDEGKRKKGGAR